MAQSPGAPKGAPGTGPGASAVADGRSETLVVSGLAVHFQGIKALDGIDLTAERSEILGLIGPNGAGKTTLVNAISGFEKLTTGTIELGGQDVTGWAPERRARAGLSRTFQSVRLFGELTVRENVEAAALGVGASRRDARKRVEDVLAHMQLGDIAERRANALPQGTERMLGIARSLATHPAFLLLDEPAAGLNDGESQELVRTLRELHSLWNCGVLIIEHDMTVIMNLCDRVQVLDYGKTISLGTPAEVRADPAVLRAYLGDDDEDE
jgi:branched-chain amino acid transport system ATP-binding protein